jgi:CelD/BcsL family acetyltransferase involved in cellulose biosynthesis
VHADVVHPRELGPEQAAHWRSLQRQTPLLGSPFLGPAFARIVGAERADARVAVLTDGAGFFAFHRGPGGIGSPLGRTLADYQAFVAAPGLDWEPDAVVRASGLRTYAFDHALLEQEQWRAFARAAEPSPVVDLERFDAAADMPGEAGRKARRLDREGEPRVEWHDPDPAALATLVRWKRDQYARTGVYDIFSHAWVPAVVGRLHAAAEEDLTGVLACLYDGDDLIAAHLLLQAGPILHSWMPAHDPDRAKQSPGLVLLRAILLAAPAHGVRLLDFGKGTDSYKGRFANDAIEVGAGSVQSAVAWHALAGMGRASAQIVQRTRLQGRAYRAERRLQVG